MIIIAKKYSFRERCPEWILAIGLMVWGLMIATHPSLFSTSFYQPLVSVMSQASWATITILIGLIRLIALTINGVWRPTAHLRAAGAVGGILIWSSLFIISVLNSYARAPGIGTYGMLLAFDFFALWWAAGDAKLVDEIAKRQRELNGN
jgi:hypothetical protein